MTTFIKIQTNLIIILNINLFLIPSCGDMLMNSKLVF